MERISSSHSYGESALHLQLTPKKRRSVFENAEVKKACTYAFERIAFELGIDIIAADYGPDHYHTFFRHWKNYSIAQLANTFKGKSSYLIRRLIPEELIKYKLGKSFWSDGYFYETCGSITAASREYYIKRCQTKHWKKAPQAKLTEFIAKK